MSGGIPLYVTATVENFDERGYLEANPDIVGAVRDGRRASGRAHFDAIGASEGRQQVSLSAIAALQAGRSSGSSRC